MACLALTASCPLRTSRFVLYCARRVFPDIFLTGRVFVICLIFLIIAFRDRSVLVGLLLDVIWLLPLLHISQPPLLFFRKDRKAIARFESWARSTSLRSRNTRTNPFKQSPNHNQRLWLRVDYLIQVTVRNGDGPLGYEPRSEAFANIPSARRVDPPVSYRRRALQAFCDIQSS